MGQLHTLSGPLLTHSPLWRAYHTHADGCERLRTVADGCGRLRTPRQLSANTASPPDPQMKQEPSLRIREKHMDLLKALSNSSQKCPASEIAPPNFFRFLGVNFQEALGTDGLQRFSNNDGKWLLVAKIMDIQLVHLNVVKQSTSWCHGLVVDQPIWKKSYKMLYKYKWIIISNRMQRNTLQKLKYV